MIEERKKHIASYRATHRQCLWELGTSTGAYVALLLAHGPAFHGPLFWLVGPLVTLRLFMVFHDAGHGSFSPSPVCNDWIWRVLAVIIMTPGRWREDHRRHHAHFGNTENCIGYQWNPTIFHTQQELERLRPVLLRRVVGLFRHPLVFFPTAAFYEWFIRFRIPVLDHASGYSTFDNMVNTIGVAVYLGLLFLWKGKNLVVDYLIMAFFSAMYGLSLFHAQHAFENGYYRKAQDWSFVDAAFQGSSCIVFPWLLQWTMMGIGYHHIHHYDTRVPGYLLKQCHEEGNPVFWEDVTVLNFMQGSFWRTLWTTMYNDDTGRFV